MERGMNIQLHGDQAAIFTTHDLIYGQGSIPCGPSSSLKALSITLEGETDVRVDTFSGLLANSGHLIGKQRFLRLSQPVDIDHLKKRKNSSGAAIEIPFSFTVPERLLPYACTHEASTELVVRDEHTLLPPSLGELDDKELRLQYPSPKAAAITYRVYVRATVRHSEGARQRFQHFLPVHIIPSRQRVCESIAPHAHTTSVAKAPRLRLGSPKQAGGFLSAEAAPLDLEVAHWNDSDSLAAMSHLPLHLHFAGASQPPSTVSITVRLGSITFYSAIPKGDLPDLNDCVKPSQYHTSFESKILLDKQVHRDLHWYHQDSDTFTEPPRYDDTCTSMSRDTLLLQASRQSSSVVVPISIPRKTKRGKSLVYIPSFNSCHVSRQYFLEVNMKFHPPSGGRLPSFARAQSLRLNVPMHLSIVPRASTNRFATSSIETIRKSSGPRTFSGATGYEDIDIADPWTMKLQVAKTVAPPAYTTWGS